MPTSCLPRGCGPQLRKAMWQMQGPCTPLCKLCKAQGSECGAPHSQNFKISCNRVDSMMMYS